MATTDWLWTINFVLVIWGILLVLTDRELTLGRKALWCVALVVLQFIGVVALFLFRRQRWHHRRGHAHPAK
jgi:hypothetical protein